MAPSANTEQTFSFEIVSCLLASLLSSNVTIGSAHFALMEKIDGSTTKSGYEHRFRAVKARAKEINEKIATGEIKADATPIKAKARAGSKSATPAGSKRKARSEKPTGDQSEGASCAQDEDDEEVGKTPTKRAKVVKKEKNEEFSFF